MSEHSLFESKLVDGVMVVIPLRNMGEFEMASARAGDVSPFDRLTQLTNGYNVVIDLSQTDYFGSSTIGLFNRFNSHVKEQNRRIAFCNLSPHEHEVVRITHVNKLWNVKDTLSEALQSVTSSP